MMVDPHGPIDKLEDLEASDWECLREWVEYYKKKERPLETNALFYHRKPYLRINIYLLANW